MFILLTYIDINMKESVRKSTLHQLQFLFINIQHLVYIDLIIRNIFVCSEPFSVIDPLDNRQRALGIATSVSAQTVNVYLPIMSRLPTAESLSQGQITAMYIL